MRIERIRGKNLTGLGDVDLTFSTGPVLLFIKDRSHQTMLRDLLLELLYDLKQPSKAQTRKSLVELWVAGETTRFHIKQFNPRDDQRERCATRFVEDQTGQKVSWPETMTLGESLFQVKPQAFLQGVIVDWPKSNENTNFSQRVRNIWLGGDEGLSLTKVRACIAVAQKRVKEQTESMVKVKAEYDALRCEWEEAHRQREKDRLLQIEIKNLQEKEKILAEKITEAVKIQERLAVLRQNPDYRELRQLHGEVSRLEERYRQTESDLTALTRESPVDWGMIEALREECLEWACLQEQVDRIAASDQMRKQLINVTQNFLQTSGYKGLPDNEERRLRRVVEERDSVQKKLDQEVDNLTIVKAKLENLQDRYTEETMKLQNLAVMAGVTDATEIKLAQKERHLAQWQMSKLGSFLDRTLQEQFGTKGITERLSSSLATNYKNYHASNYKEFKSLLKEFRNQRELVDQLEIELEQLQDKVRGEEKERKQVDSLNKVLEQAYGSAKVTDFSAWLNGWEEYHRKKGQLVLWHDELQIEREKRQRVETKMAASAEQLRDKLGNWGTSTTDRDEVLAVVFKVARLLRAKDEAAKEVAQFSQKYKNLLGDRNMEHLARILEPLADLERETHLLQDEKMEELTAWRNEKAEIRQQLEAAVQNLNKSQKFQSLSVLEKKVETVKRQWMAYEGLHSALDDANTLLEDSWQEWKAKYEKALKVEKQRICSKLSSPENKGASDYFAYRMAIVQLAFSDNIEVPLLFLGGEMNEGQGQGFWEEVLGYLSTLALNRQVIFVTSDAELWQIIAANNWQKLMG